MLPVDKLEPAPYNPRKITAEALRRLRTIVRREGLVILPRRMRLLEEFAAHLAADAKRLVEDDETGAQVYRYVKTGTNHYSFAFTYDCIAWSDEAAGRGAGRMHVGILSNDEIEALRRSSDFNLWTEF